MLSLLRATGLARSNQLQVGKRGFGSTVRGFTESVGNTPLVSAVLAPLLELSDAYSTAGLS